MRLLYVHASSCSVCCCCLEKASCISRQPFNRHLLPLQAFIKEVERICWHLSWISWHQASKGSKALYYTTADLGALCQTINWAVRGLLYMPTLTDKWISSQQMTMYKLLNNLQIQKLNSSAILWHMQWNPQTCSTLPFKLMIVVLVHLGQMYVSCLEWYVLTNFIEPKVLQSTDDILSISYQDWSQQVKMMSFALFLGVCESLWDKCYKDASKISFFGHYFEDLAFLDPIIV